MITATVIFYNDGPEMLERALVHLKAHGFFIVAVDGAFQEWMKVTNTDIPYSTDSCIDVARYYADEFMESPTNGWKDEMSKRNVSIVTVPVGDYFMISDADEVIPEGIFDQDLHADVYRMWEHLHRMDGREPSRVSRNRVFKKYDDLAFLYQHCRLYRTKEHDPRDLGSGLVSRSATGLNNRLPFLKTGSGEDAYFDHYPLQRPTIRQDIKKEYAKIRGENAYPF